MVKQRQGHCRPRLTDARSECWLVLSDPTDFSDREVLEHTMCHSLHVCCLSMHRRRLVVLEVTTYIRIEIFYHRMKVITSSFNTKYKRRAESIMKKVFLISSSLI